MGELTRTQSDQPEASNEPPPKLAAPTEKRQAATLLASIFCIAACGLVYELLIASVSSYLLGNSVTQFSLAIGIFIGSMGLGAHFSKRVTRDLLYCFVLAEIILALLGGVSVLLLFASYSHLVLYWVMLYGLLISVGALVGFELPILMRQLKEYGTLREVVAHALTFDYAGALLGSILFPLLFLPTMGLTRTALFMGLCTLVVALWNISVFHPVQDRLTRLKLPCTALLVIFLGIFAFGPVLQNKIEGRLYRAPVIFSEQTKYQRLVMTKWRDDLRLFINGNLQFCSIDEYRYHEALVHPAIAMAPRAESVLILGGGEGLTAREILKHKSIKSITIVDIDPRIVELSRTHPLIRELNEGSLGDPRVTVINEDAYKFVEKTGHTFDLIFSDLPDPNHEGLTKLYSVQFYNLLASRLNPTGILSVQSTSPFFARDAFWCIYESINTSKLTARAAHTYVPSFGDWGFVIAGHKEIKIAALLPEIEYRYLNNPMVTNMFVFPEDQGPVKVEPSTLDKPIIMEYYHQSSQKWMGH